MRFCVVHDFTRKRLVFKGIFVYLAPPPMLRLWLIFAQATTIAVAALFVVSTFRPEWLPSRMPAAGGSPTASAPLTVQQAVSTGPQSVTARVGSYHDAVKRATPSVVNIFTSKEIRS